MDKPTLSERESRRYKSHIEFSSLGTDGQLLIKQTKVLVVGSGSLGTSVMKVLIAAGIGYLGICDNNIIDEDDLSKQTLFNDKDIGKQKAIVARENLMHRNQYTNIELHNLQLTNSNIQNIIKKYDLIVDTTNLIESHEIIGNAAQDAELPVILGHINHGFGYISKCESGNKKKLTNSLKVISDQIKNQEKEFSYPIFANTFTGALIANEVIKTITKSTSQVTHNLLIIRFSDYSLTFQPV